MLDHRGHACAVRSWLYSTSGAGGSAHGSSSSRRDAPTDAGGPRAGWVARIPDALQHPRGHAPIRDLRDRFHPPASERGIVEHAEHRAIDQGARGASQGQHVDSTSTHELGRRSLVAAPCCTSRASIPAADPRWLSRPAQHRVVDAGRRRGTRMIPDDRSFHGHTPGSTRVGDVTVAKTEQRALRFTWPPYGPLLGPLGARKGST